MIARSGEVQLEELAHRSFLLITRMMLGLPRARRRNTGDLKEMEFQTLAALHQHQTMIVGDIQRILGVLPAQMSRIIRSLEDRERPLIACRINPQDKRKIDVGLTPAGARAFEEHQGGRVRAVASLLGRLPDEDLDDLQRLLEKVQELIGSQNAI